MYGIGSKHFTWIGLKLRDGKLRRYSGKIWPGEALIKTLFYPPSSIFCVSYVIICWFSTTLGVWWSCDWTMPRPFPTPLLKAGKSALGTRLVNSRAQWILFEHWFTYTTRLNFTRFKGIIKAFSRMRVRHTSITVECVDFSDLSGANVCWFFSFSE